jgi:drug/metabolite transporter (DMT)-like permease
MTTLARQPRLAPKPRTIGVPRTTTWGLALALATACISGVAVWLNAYAVKQVPDPALYTTLKNGVAALLLITLLWTTTGFGPVRALSGRQWAWLLVIGLVGGSVAFLLFFSGLAQATAPGAAFIHKTLFVWVALLAVPLLGERLGAIQIAAMAALLAGQVILTPPNVQGAGWGAGETMIAAATLLWSVEVILAKRILASVPSLVLGAARLGFGVLFLVGYLAATGGLGTIAQVTPAGWAWVAVTGLVLAAYVGTWFAALSRAPASAVASVLVLGAVITTLLQALSNGVMPTAGAALGGVLVAAMAAVLILLAVRQRADRFHTV